MSRFQVNDIALRFGKRVRRDIFVAVCLLAALSPSRPTFAAALSELLAGSSITVGDCLFTDWQLVSLDATGTSPNLNLVLVNPLTNDLEAPGLQFAGNNQFVVTQFNALDLVLKYRVQALPAGNTFEGHSLTITGLTFAAASGIGFVSNGMSTGLGGQLESAVAIGDPANEVFQFADTASFTPQSGMWVTTNIFLQGLAPNDSINLSVFNQRFLQTGPPVLEGDYNQNGVVDTADYAVWRNAVGAPAGTLPNDTSGAVIGSGQYATWKSQFGATGGAGATSVVAPEPFALLLLLLGSPYLGALPARRRSR